MCHEYFLLLFCSDVSPSIRDVTAASNVSPASDVTLPTPASPLVNPTHGRPDVDTMVPGYVSDYQQSHHLPTHHSPSYAKTQLLFQAVLRHCMPKPINRLL